MKRVKLRVEWIIVFMGTIKKIEKQYKVELMNENKVLTSWNYHQL